MPCNMIDFGDGTTAIVCTRGRRQKPCRWCGRPHTKLCDFPLSGAKAGKTCDAPMCDRCATSVGPNLDYCPPHTRYSETLKTEKARTDG
jgi:hypothetical protein